MKTFAFPPPFRIGLAASLLAITASTASMGARAADPAARDNADQEVVTLAEFNVRAVQDGSYDAVDSVSLRVRTETSSLPFNLNVVTSEFMQDFAAFELEEELEYTSSFAKDQSEGVYSLRGISVGMQLRNGFRAQMLRGSVTTSRVEVIKGPSASIYGQSSPGGIINTITKRPKATREGQIRFSFGSLGTRRSELELTGPLAPTAGPGRLSRLFQDTYYLLTVADYYNEYELAYAYKHQWQAAFTLTKKFSADTSLTLQTEYIIHHALDENPLPFDQAVINGATVYRGLATDLWGFNYNSPDAYSWNHMGAGFLTFEHRINRGLFLRIGANHIQTHNRNLNYRGNTAVSNPRRVTGREPYNNFGSTYVHGLQGDLLANFRTPGLEHRTLITLDYMYQRGTRSTTRLRNSSSVLRNPAFNIHELSVEHPNYFLLPWSPANFTRAYQANANVTNVYGAFLRHEIAAFDGRLLGSGGIRYDYVDFDLQDKRTPTVVRDKYHSDAVTASAGLNYKLREDVVLYASRADSFVPPTSSGTTAINTGRRYLNETGLGYEGGVKFSLWERRLNATVCFFHIDRQNVRIREIVDNELVDASAGLERSRGVELDFNWKASRAWQLFGGYGYADSFIVYSGYDLDAVGRRPRSTPAHQGGAGMRYAFHRGGLNGLVCTAGVTYKGESSMLSPISGAVVGNDGYIHGSNGMRNVTLPEYTIWNLGANYTFRTLRGLSGKHRVQANVKNLFDKRYIDNRGRAAPRLMLIGSYALGF